MVSGLLRNAVTLFGALTQRGAADPWKPLHCHFWITPFDCGTRVLKSDKYLQLAESAQLDFLIKTRCISVLLRQRCRFVNASQLIVFRKPVGMFSRVQMETRILFADDKCTYFSHSFFVRNQRCGEVLVKTKFKRGARTVRPADIFGPCSLPKPTHLDEWDRATSQLASPSTP